MGRSYDVCLEIKRKNGVQRPNCEDAGRFNKVEVIVELQLHSQGLSLRIQSHLCKRYAKLKIYMLNEDFLEETAHDILPFYYAGNQCNKSSCFVIVIENKRGSH